MEYLLVALACVAIVAVYYWADERNGRTDAEAAARESQAEAAVQKARADRAIRVLKTWGKELDDLELEAAQHRTPAEAKSHIRGLTAGMRKRGVPPDKDG